MKRKRDSAQPQEKANCGYSREILALYVEADLPGNAVGEVDSHVARCGECREYCEQLRQSQSFIKSRFGWDRQEPVSPAMFARMRQGVMSQIDEIQHTLGWTLRLERFLTVGLRKHRYVAAGFAVAAILSASLLGQIRYTHQDVAAVFVGTNTLVRPAEYRDWVFVGNSLDRNVYIDPAAYREFTHSGQFPDGTVMVLEVKSAEEQKPGLQVSVKDPARFDGGWGFYEFTDSVGQQQANAEPLPQNAGCRACHRDKAAKDHVFTQFYPVLRNIRG